MQGDDGPDESPAPIVHPRRLRPVSNEAAREDASGAQRPSTVSPSEPAPTRPPVTMTPADKPPVEAASGMVAAAPSELQTAPAVRTLLPQKDLKRPDRPTPAVPPQLRPPTPLPIPNVRNAVPHEQRIVVHIGAIEIRAPEQGRLPSGPPLPPSALPPAPAGFDAYARLRAYTPWMI
jgi:hypothetical protein